MRLCDIFVVVVVGIFDVAVTIDVADVFIVVIAIYVAVSVGVAVYIAASVGYFHCRNSVIKILITVITVNIVPYVSGTTVNVIGYVIILILVIVGADGGGGGGG